MTDNPMQSKEKKPKRGALYAPLSFLIIVAAMVFGMSVFFKVSHIEVTGNETYTEEEIIEASGITEGDNLFFINRFTAASRIYARLPYVDKTTVTRALPNRVLIAVTESSGLACLTQNGTYWAIDQNGKVLGDVSAAEAQKLISLSGMEVKLPETGAVLEETEDSGRVSSLASLLNALDALDMAQNVTMIDMSNAASPTFDYLGRFTVKLGSPDEATYKLELLLASIQQLGASDSGIFDLSVEHEVHFSPT